MKTSTNNQKVSAILAVVLLMTALSGCGAQTSDEAVTTQANNDEQHVETQTAELVLKDNLLEDIDYQGQEVSIAYYDLFCTKELVPEQIGAVVSDVISDAVLKRNQKVEERLNIKLNMVNSGADWSGIAKYVRNLAVSGDNTYAFVDALEMDVDSLYQLVLNNKWTLDRMYTLAPSLYENANGNGAYDNRDKYGCGTITGVHSWHLFMDVGGCFALPSVTVTVFRCCVQGMSCCSVLCSRKEPFGIWRVIP